MIGLTIGMNGSRLVFLVKYSRTERTVENYLICMKVDLHVWAHSGAVRIVMNGIVCSNCEHVYIFDYQSHGISASSS